MAGGGDSVRAVRIDRTHGTRTRTCPCPVEHAATPRTGWGIGRPADGGDRSAGLGWRSRPPSPQEHAHGADLDDDRQQAAAGGIRLLAPARKPVHIHGAPGRRAGTARAQPLDGERALRHGPSSGTPRSTRTSPTSGSPGAPSGGADVAELRRGLLRARSGRARHRGARRRCATTCPAARWARPSPSTSARSPPSSSTTTCAGFKQVLETGEVVRSDGAPWGKQARRSSRSDRRDRCPRRERNGGGAGVRANCWMGANKVEVRDVPDPRS